MSYKPSSGILILFLISEKNSKLLNLNLLIPCQLSCWLIECCLPLPIIESYNFIAGCDCIDRLMQLPYLRWGSRPRQVKRFAQGHTHSLDPIFLIKYILYLINYTNSRLTFNAALWMLFFVFLFWLFVLCSALSCLDLLKFKMQRIVSKYILLKSASEWIYLVRYHLLGSIKLVLCHFSSFSSLKYPSLPLQTKHRKRTTKCVHLSASLD